MISRRGALLGSLFSATQAKKKPPHRGATVPTPSTLRATVMQDGTAAGQSAVVLVDGADTMVTANGVAGYVPQQDDRVLVQQVGGQVEILQFLDRTYITGQTIRTAPSGPRFEVVGASDAFHPSVIAGYTAAAIETTPAIIEVLGSVAAPGRLLLDMVAPQQSAVPVNAAITLETVRDTGKSDVTAKADFLHLIALVGGVDINGTSSILGITFGNVTVTVPSGGSTGTTGNIAHGLPATPKYVGVIPNAATSLYFGYLAGGLTSTTMNLGARLISGTVGSNTNINLLWFAIC